MKFKQLRQMVDELHRGYPEIDDAEVKINIGHSVVDFDEISHLIKEDMVVLFPYERDQPGRGDQVSGKPLRVECNPGT